MLKNPRREQFAQLLASGKTAKDAYALAGYKASESNAAWLARKEEISSRVADISNERWEQERAATAAAVQRTAITRQVLVEKLEATRAAAEAAGQYSAAVTATKEIAVLLGIRIERSERGGAGEFDWMEKLTTEQLRGFVEGTLELSALQPPESERNDWALPAVWCDVHAGWPFTFVQAARD